MVPKLTKTSLSLTDFVRGEREPNTLTINIKGEDTTWEYKNLTWYEKNKCVSKATIIGQNENGEASLSFDLATYYLEALQTMLVGAPIPITINTLKELDSDIGDRLISIVPAPMGGEGVEEVKKA